MEEFLLCIHTIREHTLEDLRRTVLAKEVGFLSYAARIIGPIRDEANEILHRNQLLSLSKYGAGLPVLNLLPFTGSADVEGNTEFYASISDVYSIEAARKLWSAADITNAMLAFDEWQPAYILHIARQFTAQMNAGQQHYQFGKNR